MNSLKRLWSRFESWLSEPRERAVGAIFTLVTLCVVGIQTYLLIRQANLMDLQTQISDRQLAMAIRPQIATHVYGPWVWKITNRSPHTVRNWKVTFLHFKKYLSGWNVGTVNPGISRPLLSPGETWEITLAQATHDVATKIEGAVPVEGWEFLVALLQFERDVDGKGFVYLEPFVYQRGQIVMWLGGEFATSGPLKGRCFYPLELAHDYLGKQPLPGYYEIYNNYIPTGCLDLEQSAEKPTIRSKNRR